MKKQQLAHLILRLDSVQKEIEHSINCTPTGADRNHLTDVNIHVMSAIMDLSKVGSNAPVDAQN